MTMEPELRVRQAFREQAVWCERLGSPFTARLLDAAVRVLDPGTNFGKRILEWSGQPNARGDALPLRLAGGLHALVRAGTCLELARLYPPNPLPSREELVRALVIVFETSGAELDLWLDSAPQTNEVARSAILYPGLMEIARHTALPLALHEIGSSAGLNLVLDRYRYTLGGLAAGAVASPVHLAPEWSGPAPSGPEPRIARRRGCDLAPFNLEAGGGERLMAYVWPDQPQRLDRLSGAIAVALQEPPTIDRDDAAAWVERRLGEEPGDGVARVLMHSIMFQYLGSEAQRRIASSMHAAGASATSNKPLFWLTFELDAEGGAVLTLTSWPGGTVSRLAHSDSHVRHVTWQNSPG